MTALNILHDNNVTILFEKENLDTADPTSDFILTTLAAIAQEESRKTSTRVKWGQTRPETSILEIRCAIREVR